MTYDLDHCTICKRDLPPLLKEHAHQRFEETACSTECRAERTKRAYACCEKAEWLDRYCVCMYAFKCPVHGETHIGTHD